VEQNRQYRFIVPSPYDKSKSMLLVFKLSCTSGTARISKVEISDLETLLEQQGFYCVCRRLLFSP